MLIRLSNSQGIIISVFQNYVIQLQPLSKTKMIFGTHFRALNLRKKYRILRVFLGKMEKPWQYVNKFTVSLVAGYAVHGIYLKQDPSLTEALCSILLCLWRLLNDYTNTQSAINACTSKYKLKIIPLFLQQNRITHHTPLSTPVCCCPTMSQFQQSIQLQQFAVLPAPPLRELTCHIGSHSVTCHPTEVTFPPIPQPKLVLD